MINRSKSYEEIIKEQREAHGKRVEARQKEKYDAYYGRYGWRDGLATPMRDLGSNSGVED